jgi:hypothetical protein
MILAILLKIAYVSAKKPDFGQRIEPGATLGFDGPKNLKQTYTAMLGTRQSWASFHA